MRRTKTGAILCVSLFIITGQAVLAQGPPDYWDPQLDDMGASWEVPPLTPGQEYWKLISVEFLDETESGLLHHMMYKCLDSGGTQLANVRIVQEWDGGSAESVTKASPDWGDIPMWGSGWCNWYPNPRSCPEGPYDGYVGDGRPSYKLIGCGLPANHHVVYQMIFQLRIATNPVDTPTPTETPPGGTVPTVNNPSFESCVTGWSMWTGSGSNGDALECDLPPGGVVDGSWCLAAKGIGAGGKGAYQYRSSDWIPGNNYRLSVYCENLINTNMNYSIGYVLGSGSAANGPTANYGTTVVNPSSWTQATVDFMYSGSSGVTIYLRAVNAGSSERAGFDLVEITNLGASETPTPTPTNTYATPPPTVTPSGILEDYEDGFTGGVENDWTAWQDSWGGPDLREADLGRTGVGFSQGVRVYYGSGGAFRQDIPVTPGEGYYLRTWIKTLSGDRSGAAPADNAVVWAEFGYDLQNRDFAALGSDPGITYWETTPKENANLGSTSWQEFTTPAFTATGPFISIWVKAGCTSPLGLYLSIDDWELVSTSAPPDPTSTPTVTRTPTSPLASPTMTPVRSMVDDWEKFSPDR